MFSSNFVLHERSEHFVCCQHLRKVKLSACTQSVWVRLSNILQFRIVFKEQKNKRRQTKKRIDKHIGAEYYYAAKSSVSMATEDGEWIIDERNSENVTICDFVVTKVEDSRALKVGRGKRTLLLAALSFFLSLYLFPFLIFLRSSSLALSGPVIHPLCLSSSILNVKFYYFFVIFEIEAWKVFQHNFCFFPCIDQSKLYICICIISNW